LEETSQIATKGIKAGRKRKAGKAKFFAGGLCGRSGVKPQARQMKKTARPSMETPFGFLHGLAMV
jgi:hypothetical protein